jgi:hypothetical protein
METASTLAGTMTLSIIIPAICLMAFFGLIAVSRPRGAVSPKFFESGLVQVLYPVFLLELFVAGAGGLWLNLN